ncbi:MAG: hypothetical protein R3242_02905 [Akkermansiaceae bacterium]|nr:hypothetical protein [Akkermansiaceae bacterium]
MKAITIPAVIAAIAAALPAAAQSTNFTNFIRQVQYPDEVIHDMSVAQSGEALSALPIDPGGARFELWTVDETIPESYLLSSNYVGTYIPVVSMTSTTEDNTSEINRTRCDRPFSITYSVEGLRTGEDDPAPSKSVDFFWHVQSYGEDGTGENIDRTQATLHESASISEVGQVTLNFALTSVPASDLSKVRGEERFSIYSLEDYQAPASELASQTIQIWPVADGNIQGLSSGELVRYKVPQLTLNLNDLYPFSTTYAQAYKGNAALGTVGKILPGSALVIDEPVPQDRVLVIGDYGDALGEDGVWTIELLTQTPFGIDRLAYVTFNLDRTMKVRATQSGIE